MSDFQIRPETHARAFFVGLVVSQPAALGGFPYLLGPQSSSASQIRLPWARAVKDFLIVQTRPAEIVDPAQRCLCGIGGRIDAAVIQPDRPSTGSRLVNMASALRQVDIRLKIRQLKVAVVFDMDFPPLGVKIAPQSYARGPGRSIRPSTSRRQAPQNAAAAEHER